MSVYMVTILCSVLPGVLTHFAEVSAPWKIPEHEAHSFLTKPTRFKRSDPRCNTDEHYCETSKESCMKHNEQSREYYCGLGHNCSASLTCYLSVPCPAHYVLGCLDCRPGPADVIFVLDTSGSTSGNINRSIGYIDQFVRRIPIGPDDFQVGLITYNFEPTVIFDLDDFNTSESIINAIQVLTDEDGATYTDLALQEAYKLLTNQASGARLDETVYKYIVLLYDGLSSDRNGVIQNAIHLNTLGIRIYTVGFGTSISHMEMMKLSDKPYRTFSPLNQDDMYNRMIKESVNSSCQDCLESTATDVVLLLDVAYKQTFNDFKKRINAVRYTIDHILTYNPNASIGMYTYSDDIQQQFSLSWSTNKDDIISRALEVDKDNHMSTSNTSHALLETRRMTEFKSPKKIVVLFTNGDTLQNNTVQSDIEILQNDDIEVMSIVTGEDADFDDFMHIFRDPSYVFYIEDEDFSALDALAAMTSRYICDEDIFSKRLHTKT